MDQDQTSVNDRHRIALEMRVAGVGFKRIAVKLGYSAESGAFHAVKAALKKTSREQPEDLRNVEEDRLNVMLFAIWPEVRSGNLTAISTALKIMERRAKMRGLDEPIRTDNKHSGSGGGSIGVTFSVADVERFNQVLREYQAEVGDEDDGVEGEPLSESAQERMDTAHPDQQAAPVPDLS